MFDCDAIAERMPLLLTEALPSEERERAYTHIEQCAACSESWRATRNAWAMLGEVPEVRVPSRVRERFLAEARAMQPASTPSNVVPFQRRVAARWLAQAAAVAVLIGGSFFAGRHTPATSPAAGASQTAQAAAAGRFNIAESMVVPASMVNPDIQGRPDIANVHFLENSGSSNQIGVSFDVTQHVTVTGAPTDHNMVRLVSHFLQDRDATLSSRSNAVQWVRDQYTDKGAAQPELVSALASLLKNDTQEGVRIKAVDALKSIRTPAPEVRDALVEALKNDPNPSVRMKAVDALANMAHDKSDLGTSALETLRQKASQNDENPYVRVKAAEALSSMKL